MANFNKPKCQCWWWNLIHMESYSPRNAAWEQYLEYQKGVPQHGIFMLIASTWSVQDGSTALGLSHSEEQDHELWQYLQGSLGELKSPLSEPKSTHHSSSIPWEVNHKINVVGLLSVSQTANEEGAPNSQLQLIIKGSAFLQNHCCCVPAVTLLLWVENGQHKKCKLELSSLIRGEWVGTSGPQGTWSSATALKKW